MGCTHPYIFTALDGPTVLFARKQLRFACYLHLVEKSKSLLFASVQFCPRVNAGPGLWWQIRKQGDRGSRNSVAKAESLGKFLLVFINVDQVHMVFGIFVVNSEHREMRRGYNRYHAQHVPHTGL